MREKILYALGVLAGVLFIRNAYVILLHLPDEAEQGAIYRILFYHLPAFFTAALCYLSALGTSIAYLRTRNAIWDAYAAAATETGLAFAAINLVTGMVWAKIIWGVWWVWDARLTWALICWLVYFGYLMLRNAIDDPSERAKNSAVLSVFAFASVAITWKAIEWWRRLPLPKADGGTGEGTSHELVLVGAGALRLNWCHQAAGYNGRRSDACLLEKLSSLHDPPRSQATLTSGDARGGRSARHTGRAPGQKQARSRAPSIGNDLLLTDDRGVHDSLLPVKPEARSWLGG